MIELFVTCILFLSGYIVYQEFKILFLKKELREERLIRKQSEIFCGLWEDKYMDKVFRDKSLTIEQASREINNAIIDMNNAGIDFENKVRKGEIKI